MAELIQPKIFVAIATIGRSSILCQVLRRISSQDRQPDGVVVVGTCPADVDGAGRAYPGSEVLISQKGLCRQRNMALRHLAGRADIVVFFDDDFVPDDGYLTAVERQMMADPALIGLTGHLLADGAQTGEICFAESLKILDGRVLAPRFRTENTSWLYGCNMAIRTAAAPDLRFDERLPLYGWQEDVDFSSRLGRFGAMLRSRDLTGVHLGTRSGRISGVRFGYSQIANIIYLRRKQTIGARHGLGLMARNVASNLARSLWSEPHIDRRGRLAGNAIGFADLLRGRVDPGRVERL
ncbi:glycosyltransferase [Novosphingobium sp.]|uniref:glycosyltransferase family 2 protein n=1 Tax=Novosphingobium sp. TaxID=1874826 RepID=UPI0025D65BF2|nr:glycosyltransferase [Novosphingobium sp.]